MEHVPQQRPKSASAIPAKPMFQPRPFGESIQPKIVQPASEEQAPIDRPPIRNPDYAAIFAKPPARSAPWKPAPPIQRQADGNQADDGKAESNTTASEAFQAQQSPESPDPPARSPFWHLRRRVDPQAGVQQATERQASPLASTNLLDVLIRNAQASAASVQAKLTIGQPNDQYEQEADATAAKVMAMPDVQRQTASHPEEEEDPVQAKQMDESIAPIQREASPEEEEVQTKPIASLIQREAEPEEEVQTKPLAASITPLVQREALPEEEEPVQAKALAQPLDQRIANLQREALPEEEEAVQTKSLGLADLQREEGPEEEEPVQAKALAQPLGQRIANLQREALPEEEEAVQPKSLQQADLQREEVPEEEEPVQAKAISSIQREALPEVEEPIQTKAIATIPRLTANKDIQRKSSTPSPAAHLESQLAAQKGGGSPLGDEVRSFMESRFNTDFSHVRVHTDSSAVQMNKDLSAQAFTHGSDIYFGAGKSPGQNELTAHELTHVVQQTGARKQNKEIRLRLKKQEEGPTTTEFKKQDDRPSSATSNKGSKQSLSQLQTENKAEPPISSQPQPNKEVSPASSPPDASKPTVVDATAKGGTPAKVELAPEQAKPKTDAAPAPGVQNAAQAPPANLAAAKPEGTISDMKSAMGEGAAVGGVAAAPVPQADAAPAVGDVGGGSAEGEAEQTGDDKELEAAAIATEGVELAAGDRADATASLAEVADSGGAPAEGGGGGGGAAIADKPAPPVPDVSGADPAQALSTISQLPPAQLQAGLGGVTSAVGSTVGKERTELATNPPQMERPTGSPMTKEGTGDRAMPASKTPPPVEKSAQKQAQPVPQPQPLPPLPPSPIQSVPQPGGDPQAVKASLDRLPTRDPSLNVTAGSPPPLTLQGDADPNQAQEQKAKLEKSLADSHAHGQQELAQPMGEDEIYPHVPKETLKAEGIGGGGAAKGSAAGGGGGAAKGTEGDDAISVIAQQEHGQEIQAAVSQAQSQMAAKRQEHTVQVAQEKEKSNKDVAKLQSESETQQAQERSKAQTEVSKQKESWNKEQTDLVSKSRKDSDTAVAKGMKDVQQEQTQAEAKANQHIEKGNQEAETARKQGEEQATAEKQKANQDSGGIFGWLADKAKAFFDGIKQAIQKAFEIARAAVKLAIDTAKKLATEVIEAARKAIVAVIKVVGDALIAIGDVLLAAFPEMRDRFRNAIKSAVKAAETAVNFLADKLKQGVLAALTLLGKGLDAALGLLEKGMLAAVEVAKASVLGAISAAKAAVEALGAFAVLAKDIAANPGQWLSNLGAGVMDGIRNHLWTAFQTAVKDWFNQKVEELLGLGMTVWNLLKKGGMGMAEIGHMAWEGIKSAIPPALIQILVEKLVAMIVPAAGAVLAVIEGLQAAWGTVSRILQAMERFMAFLKVVKSGQSGPQFGALLAAAGVILIDFAANWLLKKVRGAASKVAGKIKAIAQKIGNKLKKAMKKMGKKLRGGMKKLRDKARKIKEKVFGKKGEKKHADKSKDKKLSKEEAKQQEIKKRVEKAQRELPPKVSSLLKRGSSRFRLRAQLAIWKLQYRLSHFKFEINGHAVNFDAKVNPIVQLPNGVIAAGSWFQNLIRERARAILTHRQVIQLADAIRHGKNPSGEAGGIAAGARANLLQQRQGNQGQSHLVDFAISDGSRQSVTEFRPRYHATNRRVDFPEGAPGHYDYINKVLNNPEPVLGISKEEAAVTLAQINRTREIPAHLPPRARGFLASVARIDEVEGGRNPADLITRLAERDIAERGGTLFTQDPETGIITEVGPAQPSGSRVMGPKSSPAAARQAQYQSGIPLLEDGEQPAIEKSRGGAEATSQLTQREWDVVISYIIQQFGGSNAEIIMANQSEAEALIDTQIRALIARRIGISL